VVPRTRGVDPFVLKRDGLPQAIVLDTAGYDAVGAADDPFRHYRDEIVQSDLVLLACSAQSAARAADRRLLDGMRAFYQGQPHRIMPPVVVAMSHVDQLRPLHEWAPPYDLTDAGNVKARNIRAAAEAVAEGLALSADQPIVPVCLLPDRLYNVEEALAPAILAAIPEAQRVRYLRCLGSYRRRSFWSTLRQQAFSTGRLLLKAGARWAGQSATKGRS
jgi:predicted GTPase